MNHRPLMFRVAAWLLVPGQVLLSFPATALAAPPAAQQEKPVAPPVTKEEKPVAPPAVKVNRTLPKVNPVPATPKFSETPTDQEIFRARVFDEPLVPVGGGTSGPENRALADALLAYLGSGQTEDVKPVVSFLEAHPASPWRVALQTDLGVVYRRTGYFTRALSTWEEAWASGKTESDPRAAAIADRALGELAELNARLGRFERLAELFAEIEGRNVRGAAAEKISGARAGYWLMQNKPENAFRCGPMALDRILAYAKQGYRRDKRIMESRSTVKGTSLAQMQELASQLGMRMQMARRGQDAPVLVPALVHWKAGHFAALVAEKDGRYLIQDPTFGDELWVTRRALDDEGSGYFLVPAGSLPGGWTSVHPDEGAIVWGKGNAVQSAANQTKKSSRPALRCPTRKRMADYNVHSLLVSLNLVDTPVGYTPPLGLDVEFEVTYNQRESFQPQTFPYSNLGHQWTFDWLSYIEDNPSNLSQSVTAYLRGGGFEVHSGFDTGTQSYAPDAESYAVVTRTDSSPIRYERQLPDGSVEVFAQPDGAGTFPRRIFMTQRRDPQGNAVSYLYDEDLRLVAVQDAIEQVTTLSYEGPDPLKITKVTDPFGRFATFEYNSTGQLAKITDVIGIASSFSYGPGDFINALTTPYGTTRFSFGEAGIQRWIETEDPLGARERVEYRHTAPGIATSDPGGTVPSGIDAFNDYLNYRNTFVWDKRAMDLYPGDYTKAAITHFLHTVDLNVASGIVESAKEPLENRVWYNYPGQTVAYTVGTQSSPSAVARVLDDGTTQAYRYEYNSKGLKTKAIDPVGRETRFTYGTNNTPDPDPATGTGIDLLKVEQKNGGNYEVLSSYTYDSQHHPLTATDASGQTTTNTYNAQGQVLTLTTPARAGITENRTTTYAYDPNGYLQSITGPATGSTDSFSYDGYGRLRTTTDVDGYILTYDYDALDRQARVTHPDGTYEETIYNRLDRQEQRDRLGHVTHTFYDALRRPVATRDPLGRTTTQQWCTCGSLDKLIDPNSNATTWERDLQGRVTREVRADNSVTTFVYENTTSRQKSVTDAKNQTKTYTYALDGNVLGVSYANAQIPTANVTFTYDPVYNRRATMTDGVGTTTFGYTPVASPPSLGAGSLASVDGPLANDTITYSYDERGRVVGRQVNGSANDLSQTYDVLGRLGQQTTALGAFTYGYDGVSGRVASLDYPNGQTATYSYFGNLGDRRLQEIWHKRADASTLAKFDYTYDSVGNLLTWGQQQGPDPALTYGFGYDPADELTTATISGVTPAPAPSRFAYSYDKAGNRTGEQRDDTVTAATYNSRNELASKQPGGALLFRGTVSEPATVSVGGVNAQVSASNQFSASVPVPSGTSNVAITATDPSGNTRTNTYQVTQGGNTASFTYDSNGNLTGNGTRTLEWDAENRLTRVLSGGSEVARFAYDGFGRRAQRVTGGVTRSYVYDGDHVAEERLSTGGVIRYFHGAGTDDWLGQQEADGTATFFASDHLGSVRQQTNSAGQVTLSRSYDPWGNLDATSATVSGPAFTGRDWDSEAGLYYYKARYYDADLGRFISEDPVGFAGGKNYYRYVANNPVNLTDPSGLKPCSPPEQKHCQKICKDRGADYVGCEAYQVPLWPGTWFVWTECACKVPSGPSPSPGPRPNPTPCPPPRKLVWCPGPPIGSGGKGPAPGAMQRCTYLCEDGTVVSRMYVTCPQEGIFK